MMNIKILSSISVLTLAAVVVYSMFDSNPIVSAQVVDIDEPTTTQTEELDVKLDPTEPLPANGTIIVDVSEADDVDIETIPPEDVTIVVTNTTVTVTNADVEIPDQDDESPDEEEDEEDE